MLPNNFHDTNVTIIGLGYVGLTLAVAMADAGFRVHGVERDRHVLACLAEKRAHFSEVGLDGRLALQIEKGRLTFSETLENNNPSTVYIVTVGTPVGDDKRTKFDAIRAVIEVIGERLNDDDLIVLRSTVRVGTTRDVVAPLLNQAGKRYDLAFCPERTLEGRALLELRTLPQVVGGMTNHATFRASQLFSFLTPSIIRVSSTETAEMVKLINNTQRDYIFAFANEVAEMCDAIGVSAQEVIASGNLGYARANLPLPGTVGGPCLEKDPWILAEGLEQRGYTPKLALAGRQFNEAMPRRTADQLGHAFQELGTYPQKIAVLGAAFKGRPETDDTRGSLFEPIVAALRDRFPDAEIVGWDPIVSAAALTQLGVEAATSVEAAFTGASLVVMQNNHEAFARLPLAGLSVVMRAPAIIHDIWNQQPTLEQSELADGVAYRAFGAFNMNGVATA